MPNAGAVRNPPSQGKSRGVFLTLTEYRRIMDRLERMEDALDLRRALRHPGRKVSHKTLLARLRQSGRL